MHTYLGVSAAIFGVVAVIHLLRAITGSAFIIGPVAVPVALSWAGFVITTAMCVWAIRLMIRR